MIDKIKKKRVNYKNMFLSIKEINDYNIDKLGNFLYFECHITIDDYIEHLNKIMESNTPFSKETYSTLMSFTMELEEYDQNLREEYISIYKPLLYHFLNTNFYSYNEELKKAIKMAFVLDRKYYDNFFYTIEEKKKKEHFLNIANGLEINDKIRTGIEMEDGRIREFDLIDYYMHTNIKPRSLLYILISNTNPKNLLPFKKFAPRYEHDFKLDEEWIKRKLKDRVIYGCKLDENKEIIENSGTEISETDKLFIIEYLKEHNVPITECTYMAGLIRFKKGVFKHKEDTPSKKLIKRDTNF